MTSELKAQWENDKKMARRKTQLHQNHQKRVTQI
jgi:hypothetical protein